MCNAAAMSTVQVDNISSFFSFLFSFMRIRDEAAPHQHEHPIKLVAANGKNNDFKVCFGFRKAEPRQTAQYSLVPIASFFVVKKSP